MQKSKWWIWVSPCAWVWGCQWMKCVCLCVCLFDGVRPPNSTVCLCVRVGVCVCVSVCLLSFQKQCVSLILFYVSLATLPCCYTQIVCLYVCVFVCNWLSYWSLWPHTPIKSLNPAVLQRAVCVCVCEWLCETVSVCVCVCVSAGDQKCVFVSRSV